MSAGWARGSTRAWRRKRAFVLLRDQWRCQLNLDGCVRTASHVHHMHGKTRCPGCQADLYTHLAAACAPCNLKLGDPGRLAAPVQPLTRWDRR